LVLLELSGTDVTVGTVYVGEAGLELWVMLVLELLSQLVSNGVTKTAVVGTLCFGTVCVVTAGVVPELSEFELWVMLVLDWC
jgi:hypothetical protein